jgi:hypothetical protein
MPYYALLCPIMPYYCYYYCYYYALLCPIIIAIIIAIIMPYYCYYALLCLAIMPCMPCMPCYYALHALLPCYYALLPCCLVIMLGQRALDSSTLTVFMIATAWCCAHGCGVNLPQAGTA